MIALGIRYLTGRCVSGDASQKAPEWPPHPGRVYMALAAAYFETPTPDPEEREALQWLERQESPQVQAPEGGEPRSFVEAYVPANDQHGGIAKRPRSARSFPSLHVGDDPVILHWRGEPNEGIRRALGALCTRVTRIGHPASLVQMWLTEEVPAPNSWSPQAFAPGGRKMRVPSGGTLDYLSAAYQIGERPQLSHWQGYQRLHEDAEKAVLRGPFHPRLIVLTRCAEKPSPTLGLETTLQLTSALRNAAMNAAPQPPPEWLTGHRPDGGPSQHNHAAFLPLPFVGGERGNGRILGLAIALPLGLPMEEMQRVLGDLLFEPTGLERSIRLWCGTPRGPKKTNEFWAWEMKLETGAFPPQALRSTTWTGPSRAWASVTPVVLHHYPKAKRAADVERIVRQAFESARLPEPADLSVQPVSPFRGAGHAQALPVFDEGGPSLCRYQTHVRVRFREAIEGPVLVGRGRFRGYGVFRPIGEAGA